MVKITTAWVRFAGTQHVRGQQVLRTEAPDDVFRSLGVCFVRSRCEEQRQPTRVRGNFR